MKKIYSLLSNKELLLRSSQEIQNRFLHFFLLAIMGPLLGWLIRGVVLGWNPLQPIDSVPIVKSTFVSILTAVVSIWALIALVLFVCKRAFSWNELFILSLKRLPRVLVGVFFCIILLGIYMAAVFLLLTYIPQQASGWLFALSILITIIFIVSLFIASIYLILLPYVLILTDISIWAIIPSAFTLIKGRWCKTLGLIFLIFCISLVITFIFLLGFGILIFLTTLIWPKSFYVLSVLSTIPAALNLLVFHIPLIALYVDLASWWHTQQSTATD